NQVEQKELNRAVQGPELPDHFHRVISFLIDGSGDRRDGCIPSHSTITIGPQQPDDMTVS
ncbi:MAG: hypothetical protein M3361_15835, partial [Candidatus Tectomicrobia bacterium]|nr:hypothetical protein [Candidatus Tectomicrobia bacterium]